MLKYIGNGKHITGVPARDLEDTEISQLAEIFHLTKQSFIDVLIERGIYNAPTPPKKVKAKTENKHEHDS